MLRVRRKQTGGSATTSQPVVVIFTASHLSFAKSR